MRDPAWRAKDRGDDRREAAVLSGLLLAAGLISRPVSIAGAVCMVGICVFYLTRLPAPERRDRLGPAGFGSFAVLALALLVMQMLR